MTRCVESAWRAEVIQDIDAFDAGSDSTGALVAQREKHRIAVLV